MAGRWDNRRSGRTTKMLAAAMRHCYDGGTSYVVIDRGVFEYCIPILKDLGATYICKYRKVAKFGEDSAIQFIVLPNDMVNFRDLELKGIREEHVFWDHDAIRRAFNRVLTKYHEYD